MTNKDWTGNRRTVFATLGASSHANHEREKNDYYATDPAAVAPLLAELPELRSGLIWEPACGEGHLAKEIHRLGASVYSTDLIDRGFGQGGVDFLMERHDTNHTYQHIVTNPPFKLAQEFVEHSLELLTDGYACFLLRIQFLEGQERQKLFARKKLERVLVFSKRIACALNGNFADENGKKISSAACYAWFIFNNRHNADPIVRWV